MCRYILCDLNWFWFGYTALLTVSNARFNAGSHSFRDVAAVGLEGKTLAPTNRYQLGAENTPLELIWQCVGALDFGEICPKSSRS